MMRAFSRTARLVSPVSIGVLLLATAVTFAAPDPAPLQEVTLYPVLIVLPAADEAALGLTPEDGPSEEALRALVAGGRVQPIAFPAITVAENAPTPIHFEADAPYSTATVSYDEFGFRTTEYLAKRLPLSFSLFVTPQIVDGDVRLLLNMRVAYALLVTTPDGRTEQVVPAQESNLRTTVRDGKTWAISSTLGLPSMPEKLKYVLLLKAKIVDKTPMAM
jgi:hypothetical protein